MTTPLFNAPETESTNFGYENDLQNRGFAAIAGSDEVGRGPLAGPVVAASVIFPPHCDPGIFLDSKKLSEKKRDKLYQELVDAKALMGVGIVSEKQIDKLNILQASLLAMKLSIQELEKKGSPPDYVLVDGKFEIPHPLPQLALIKGETRSASIAAASIVAKVTRDAIMYKLHKKYPEYGFYSHKGYPTKAHKRAIAVHGPCPVHRLTFRGVSEHVK